MIAINEIFLQNMPIPRVGIKRKKPWIPLNLSRYLLVIIILYIFNVLLVAGYLFNYRYILDYLSKLLRRIALSRLINKS